jgi:hypothetical protein
MTVRLVVLPGPIVFDLCPSISKSCVVLPAFLIANVTFPCFTFFVDSVNEKSFAVTLTRVTDQAGPLPFKAMKAMRYFLRNFTALSVKEHLRSQLEQGGTGAQLTPNEVELVRFAADRSAQLKELADRSPGA